MILHLGHVDELPREARRLAAVEHRIALYRPWLEALRGVPGLHGVREHLQRRINELEVVARRLDGRVGRTTEKRP
ncbi:hypothetical protein [Tolypothrix sp. VBCCA 56010]|uniref:hypothetical protein n=1 Tax=Tolypothrix sp. VBCCA 56010 TaxID=3137731 RepID=UPI003D7DC1DE